LRPHTVDRAEVPKKVGRGGPATIPAILLAKLALAKQLHGRGYGTYLLLDALSGCVGASEAGPGARLVVVDAIDQEAFEFFRKHDFQPIAPDSMTLFRSMKDVAKDFEQPWYLLPQRNADAGCGRALHLRRRLPRSAEWAANSLRSEPHRCAWMGTA
jgi:hypothetical protein